MFIVVPKSEADGDPCLTVEQAKKWIAKYELLNRLRPSAHNAMALASCLYTTGQGEKALYAANAVVEALAQANGAIPPHIKAQAYQNRGMFLRGFGRFDEARADIFKAWELDKSSDYIGMPQPEEHLNRTSTRLNSSHQIIS